MSGRVDEDPLISVVSAWIEGELDSRKVDLGATTLELQLFAQLRYATRPRVRRWFRVELVGAFLMYPSVIIFIRSSITGDMASMSMFNSQKVTLVSDSIKVARCIQMPCHPEALRPLHWGQRGAPQNQLRVSSRIARRWIREIAYFAKYVSNIFTHAR